MSAENKLTYRDVVDLWKHFVVDRSGHESADSGWSPRALIDHFLIIRSTILKQLVDAGRPIGMQMIQYIPCIKLDAVPSNECPCAPPTGCMWLKSVFPIPNYIALKSVSTYSGDLISFVKWDKFKYKVKYSRKDTSDTLKYTIKVIDGKNYLYILGDEDLELVSLEGIFEDPYCADTFPKCTEESKDDVEKKCNPWDTPFLLDQSIIPQVLNAAWSTLPQLRSVAGSDIVNDDIDNTKGDINLKI